MTSPHTGASGSGATTVDVIDSVAAADALADEWRELADTCDAGPFARPLFALTWWRHLGRGSLAIVTVRRGGLLVALAPLHVRWAGPVRVVRWLGHGLGSVAEALLRPGHDDARRVLWRTAAREGRVLDLLECHEDGPLPRPGDEALPHAVVVEPRDACPVIDLVGDAETHLALSERKRVRRTVRVARRRLAEDGLELRVRVAHDLAGLAAVGSDLRRVFDAAEEAHPRQHLLAGEWEDFTTEVLRGGTASGEVVVLVAYAGPTPMAFDIAFVTDTTLASWIGRFDPAAARYSPGHLLQCAGIDWAHAHGKDHIDLLLGDSYYKRLWADRAYRTLQLQSGPAPARGLLHATARARSWQRHLRTPWRPTAAHPEGG